MFNLNIPGTAHLGVSRAWVGQMLRLPLYTNALYLLLANGIAPVLGLAFWVLAARFYSAEAVGFTSAAMAGVGFVNLFCHLGLGVGVVRFLPGAKENATRVLNTIYSVGILATAFGSLVFVAGIPIWSAPLGSIRQNAMYAAVFVLFTIAYNLGILVDNTFVASRRAAFVFWRSVAFNLVKLLLLVVLAYSLRDFGIFASWTVGLCVSLLGLLVFLPRVQSGYRPRVSIDKGILAEVIPFSIANQLGSVLSMAPSMLLPILVINLQGAESTAYFYMAATVVGPLTMVSGAFAMSLLAEGSHDHGQLALNVKRTLKAVFLLLVPGVILVTALAPHILLLFGRAYAAEAANLLRILALAALPLALNSTYLAIKRVERSLREIVGLTAVGAATAIGLTFLLLPSMGITGAGIGLLGSHSSVSLLIVARWLSKEQTRRWLVRILIRVRPNR